MKPGLRGKAPCYFPIMDWGAMYAGKSFANEPTVAVIFTIMLIPQSLAYALPARVGLYASIRHRIRINE